MSTECDAVELILELVVGCLVVGCVVRKNSWCLIVIAVWMRMRIQVIVIVKAAQSKCIPWKGHLQAWAKRGLSSSGRKKSEHWTDCPVVCVSLAEWKCFVQIKWLEPTFSVFWSMNQLGWLAHSIFDSLQCCYHDDVYVYVISLCWNQVNVWENQCMNHKHIKLHECELEI